MGGITGEWWVLYIFLGFFLLGIYAIKNSLTKIVNLLREIFSKFRLSFCI